VRGVTLARTASTTASGDATGNVEAGAGAGVVAGSAIEPDPGTADGGFAPPQPAATATATARPDARIEGLDRGWTVLEETSPDLLVVACAGYSERALYLIEASTKQRPDRPVVVLFYGTPGFALPTLDALLRHHDVVTVVTQPDRRAHRGQRLTAPPVKERALAAGLPVLQPERVRDPGWAERLAAVGAEIAVVVAFGQILPKAVLDAPDRGSINVHASILPRYRGAAPIAWAIMRGETETGITTFQMDPGMDTGDVLMTARTPIGPDETAGELAERLSRLGADVMIETLARLDALTPTPQRHEEASSVRSRRSTALLSQ